MIKKNIYLIGSSVRNPSLKTKYNFLKESEKWSLKKLESYQLKKLKELLHIAYHHSEFYKNQFDKFNLDIDKVKSLEDLKKFPTIEKIDLINHSSMVHTNLKFKKKFLAVTSGTSGQSLKFYRNEESDSFNRAAIQRGYSWYDVNIWEKNGYFWGFNFSLLKKIKNNILDFLQNRYRIFSYEDKIFKKFVKKSKDSIYIHGYSSMVYHTAVLINKLKLPKPQRIKMVKGTSEKIFESYQKEIQKAFGVRMISEYGATESGLIAFECRHGSMHINMEGVIVEVEDSEILITNLQMKSFPIIRYKLGDYISLSSRDKKCSCGMNHPILEEVTGRVGVNVYGKLKIYPSFTFYYIFKNISKTYGIDLIYQVIQNEKGSLIFNITNKIDINTEQYIKNEIIKYFKEDMDFCINSNVILKKGKGKLKSFISKVYE
ncbi:phenylacetate--CoA ligase family protein [Polaribacter sargassicola]|uniref:phenylacetate--CoA ligase family protein n=1 Tax=Polaribacter sargassicola TaxID=2836891 RepID=UPI001F179F63|nr:phenylacetate--CoA ligase family protein [Polaribacter sp. DS7-9]MCG1036617.1 phenylacetate--CoA ligase family protein [Polaribacter sp. DS7-9]